MIDLSTKSSNIRFSGRNQEIKKAQQILHKIKSDFPASSSYIGDLLAQKGEIRLNQPNKFISQSDMISSYQNTKNIGTRLTTTKIASLRSVLKNFTDNDYKYCNALAWGIQKLRVMNCKENSELAFLIAKINGYKNVHCINLAKKVSNSSFTDLEHTVLLVNQELPANISKLDKFYGQNVDKHSAFIPNRKSIVIDPLLGIVDYWENAIQNYKSIFPQISDVKSLCVGVREEIIRNPKELQKFKHSHPEFIIKHPEKPKKPNLFIKIINYIRQTS